MQPAATSPGPPKDQRDLITPECHLCIPECQWHTRWKVLIKTGKKKKNGKMTPSKHGGMIKLGTSIQRCLYKS